MVFPVQGHRSQLSLRMSKNIVSINTDPEAEINSISDYIITEDLYKVIPELIEAIKKQKEGAKAPAAAKSAYMQSVCSILLSFISSAYLGFTGM